MFTKMTTDSKIYVAGHTGLVGSAIVRALEKQDYRNLILKNHKGLDLLDQKAVAEFFAAEKPEYVFLAAAKVGGIMANNKYPAEFLYENLVMQNNVLHQAYVNRAKKLLLLGSSCIYPKLCPQPIKEEYLLTGLLEQTNEPYAIAKIAGIKLCQSYNRQYGTNFISVMPTNLYGPNDNFDPEKSHVLPALLRRFHEAKIKKSPEVVVWGSGSPRREFLHVDDMAEACIFLVNSFNPSQDENERGQIFLNLGTGQDLTIKELAELLKEITGFTGNLKWDATKPDGTPQKLLDVSRLSSLGWRAKIDLKAGIEQTYQWYLNSLDKSQTQ